MTRKAVIYARVSTTRQETDNQIKQLETLSSLQNLKVTHIYIDEKSGRVSERPQFKQMLHDAYLRKFDIVLVWDLSRFSREGIVKTLSYIKKLKKYGVGIRSLQEPWLDTSDESMANLLIAIFSWVSEQEAKRVSERTKAGLERAKASGKHLGRPKGSKDKKPRDNFGYRKRWSK
jgi:DNA invertase Pin-like site-specific DNA recombinase